MNGFRSPVPVVVAGELAERADIVLECAPAAMFREIAKPVEDAGGFKRRKRYFEEWWMETNGVRVCCCKRGEQAVMMTRRRLVLGRLYSQVRREALVALSAGRIPGRWRRTSRAHDTERRP